MGDEGLRIGTAGWSIPRASATCFDAVGSALTRYAARLSATEINSSFHRSHRQTTYARWAASVPVDFRFAVKVPKAITHTLRLKDCGEPLARFLDEISVLGKKLGPILVQLPPSLQFDAQVADAFFAEIRSRHRGSIACEPRHATWFEGAAAQLLLGWRVARVAADPPSSPLAAEPGGWPGLIYYRLHGSPRTYYSSYGSTCMARLATALSSSQSETWCILDNTASGAATGNALELVDFTRDRKRPNHVQ